MPYDDVNPPNSVLNEPDFITEDIESPLKNNDEVIHVIEPTVMEEKSAFQPRQKEYKRRAFLYSNLAMLPLFVAFIIITITDSLLYYTLGSWSILSCLWSLPIIYAFINSSDVNFIIKNSYSFNGFIVLLTGFCATISGFSLLFARFQDKLTFFVILFDVAFIAVFGYLTNTASSDQKVSNTIKYTVGTFKNIFLFFILFFHITGVYQAIGTANDQVQHGNYDGKDVEITVNGHTSSIHMLCQGEKVNPTDPLIWFEHGLGGSHLDLAWVQKYVTDMKYGRWCSYDHGGLGWSSPGQYPRTTERHIQELKELLIKEEIKDDLFIVGHSMAGYTSRVAQRVLSNKLVGVVLIDPVDTQDMKFGIPFSCKEGQQFDIPKWIFALPKQLNTWGLPRLLVSIGNVERGVENHPDPGALMSRYFLTENIASRVSELEYFQDSCGYAKRIVSTLPMVSQEKNDETFGDIPMGILFATEGFVNQQQMVRLSTNIIARNVSTSHRGIILEKESSANTNEIFKVVWDKVQNLK